MVAGQFQLFTAGLSPDGQTARTLERPDGICAAGSRHAVFCVFHQDNRQLSPVIHLNTLVRAAQVQAVELDLCFTAREHADAKFRDIRYIRFQLDLFRRIITDPLILRIVVQVSCADLGVVPSRCSFQRKNAGAKQQIAKDQCTAGVIVGSCDDLRVLARVMDETDRRTAVILKALYIDDFCTSWQPEIDDIIIDRYVETCDYHVVGRGRNIHAQ